MTPWFTRGKLTTLDISGPSRRRSARQPAVQGNWVLHLVEGTVLVILGFLAFIMPPGIGLALFGWLFLIGGATGLVSTLVMWRAPGFWWSLLSAVFTIGVGGALFMIPELGIVMLPPLLIAFLILEGIVTIMFALDHWRELSGRWGWVLGSGVVDLALAGLILIGLPTTYTWTLMNALLVRPVQQQDIAAITRIYAHAVLHGTASFETEPPDEADMGRRQNGLLAGGFPYLVGELDGTVVGYAYAGPYRARSAYRFTVEDSVYVAPQMHKQGVGRALLDSLLVEAGARGYRQMIAVIGDSAQSASIALHVACGFKHIGVLEAVGFKFGRWLDCVLLQRALGQGAETPP